jgi:membrane protein
VTALVDRLETLGLASRRSDPADRRGVLVAATPLAAARLVAAYGPIGAVIAFMVWIWVSVLVLLIGAELNAEIEHQTAVDTTTGTPAAIGERGAVMADTVGPRRGSPAGLAFTLRHAEALADRLSRRRNRPAA